MEMLSTIIVSCVVTMVTTAVVLLTFLDFHGVPMKSAEPSSKSGRSSDPPPTQSPSQIFGTSESWADPAFAGKYSAEKQSKYAISTSNDTPSRCASLLRKRRSIFPKDFVSDGPKVNLSIIEEALAAANWAPTHGKTEPWRFVVSGPDTIDEIMDIRDRFMTETLTANGDTKGLEKHQMKIAKKRKELKNCSAIVWIIVKRVPNAKGGYMPEWEEIAAVSCAVQNFHAQLTAHWSEGVGGYWSSGGHDSWLQAPDLCHLLGARDGTESAAPGRDLVLGGFYIGVCPPEKMNQYRSKRGDIAEKVTWLY
jgi:nitroreductase